MSTFSIDDLTIDDLVDLEELGLSLDDIMADGMSGKTLKALAWIIFRKDEPELTYEEAGKRPLSQLMSLFDGEETDSPN